MADAKALWTCLECGRIFAHPNQWHSCGTYKLEDNLKRVDPETVLLYRKLEGMARKCGAVIVDPIKTGAAFKASTTFAGLELGKKRVYVGFLLAAPSEESAVCAGPANFTI